MIKRKNSHIYQIPQEKDGKWIFEKTVLGECGAIFISDTKDQADKKLRSLTLLNMSVSEEFTYEFEKDNQYYYLTIPQIDRESATYSFSIKRMVSKETVKFIDNIETTVQAIQQQKKICGIEIPPVIEKKVSKPRKAVLSKRPAIKKIDINIAQQQEAYVFIKSAMIDGFSKNEILEFLQCEFKQLTEEQCLSLMGSAQTYYMNNVADTIDIPNIIQDHISKYEKIHQYFNSIGNTIGTNRAMFLKEKLLGFHNKDTVFEFNQENNINIGKPTYNLSVLDNQETDRLNGYLKRVLVNAG